MNVLSMIKNRFRPVRYGQVNKELEKIIDHELNRITISKNTLIAAIVGALSTPMGVYTGLVWDSGNLPLSVTCIVVLCGIDISMTILWINAQSKEIRK